MALKKKRKKEVVPKSDPFLDVVTDTIVDFNQNQQRYLTILAALVAGFLLFIFISGVLERGKKAEVATISRALAQYEEANSLEGELRLKILERARANCVTYLDDNSRGNYSEIAQLLLANILFDQHSYEQAASKYLAFCDSFPQSSFLFEAYIGAAYADAMLGKHAKLLRMLSGIAGASWVTPIQGQTLAKTMADSYISLKDWANAATALQKADAENSLIQEKILLVNGYLGKK